MADIKTRDAVKGTIKTIDKAAIASERMKSAYVGIKEKAEQGYFHRAEAPGQRRVLFNVAAVFHPRCRADELDVPARQQGLEDAAGVDAALRRARAHDGVHLVDE